MTNEASFDSAANDRSPGSRPLHPVWPLLAVGGVAFLVVVPFLFVSVPSGHDFEFHMNSWMEVLGQWKQGIVYPRWAAMAHYGYGEPRFLFYPPFSWMLGAALGALLPWTMVSGAYVWLALTASGAAMFVLARRWLAARDAIFAAALYAANPYYIVIVYWRSAFAELLAGALLPLLLLLVVRAEEEGFPVALPLSAVVAAAWLTNAPSAVMVNYSLALLAVVVAIERRSARVLIPAATAVVMGAALAAFYVLPAAYEEKWVNISQVLSPGVRPQDNFLFTIINDPDHNVFNLLVSTVASAEMILLTGAVLLADEWRKRASSLWWAMLIWAEACILLMFSVTAVAWQYLPELRFMQLPWRWLLSLNVPFALLAAMGSRRWISRLAICVAMLAVLAFGWQRLQAPWWDTAADVAEMQDNMEQQRGYEGTDEYVPAGADSYEVQQDARKVMIEGEAHSRVRVFEWNAESRLFAADLDRPAKAVLRLFNYPAWVVRVNEHTVSTETTEVTGQMVIPLSAGENRVSVRLVQTRDRRAGGMISMLAAVAWAAAYFFVRRRTKA